MVACRYAHLVLKIVCWGAIHTPALRPLPGFFARCRNSDFYIAYSRRRCRLMCLISSTEVGIRDARLKFFCAQDPSTGACGFPDGAFCVWHGNIELAPSRFMPAGAVKMRFISRAEIGIRGKRSKFFCAHNLSAGACGFPNGAFSSCARTAIVHLCNECLHAPWKDLLDLARAPNPGWGYG